MPNDIPITQHEIDGVNEALAELIQDLDPLAGEALRLLHQPRNVVLYGPPGTGKTRAALQIQDAWRAQNGDNSTILTTFHPSYSYEDFIEGWRPDPEAPGGFDLKEGVFLRAVDFAATTGTPTLLIIDEINRGDVARILGEVITFIEHDKRGLDFTTAQRRDVELTVPPNLFVLGTMNTADKSINLLDVALRRRFAFVSCPPQATILSSSPELQAVVGGVVLADLLDEINRRLQQHDIEVDRQIGHALLAIPVDSPAPEQELVDRLRYDVLPLVEEYLYADREAVREVLPGFLDDEGRPIQPTLEAIANLSSPAPAEDVDHAQHLDDENADALDDDSSATDPAGDGD
jgi:5-methylcytosine-specific restriction protein B